MWTQGVNICISPQTEYSVALVWTYQHSLCYSALPTHESLPSCPHLLPRHLVGAQKETQLHNQLLILLKITHSAQGSEAGGLKIIRQRAQTHSKTCHTVALAFHEDHAWRGLQTSQNIWIIVAATYNYFYCGSIISLKKCQEKTVSESKSIISNVQI